MLKYQRVLLQLVNYKHLQRTKSVTKGKEAGLYIQAILPKETFAQSFDIMK